jgi:hypothetical protein
MKTTKRKQPKDPSQLIQDIRTLVQVYKRQPYVTLKVTIKSMAEKLIDEATQPFEHKRGYRKLFDNFSAMINQELGIDKL